MSAKSDYFNYRSAYITIALIIFWIALVLVLSDRFYLSKADEVIKQETILAQQRADDLSDSIRRNLNYLHGVPKLFTELLRVKWAVKKFGSSDIPSPLSKPDRMAKWTHDKELSELNQYLNFASTSLDVDLIYLANAAGDAISASNSSTPLSAVGINIAERAMFKLNKDGKKGMQYAMGKSTKIPGLFFSEPVFINGKFFGAVVAKTDIPSLSFLLTQINAFISDDNGVIILANDKKLEMNTLPDSAMGRLSQAEKFALYQRNDIPTLKIEPWGDKNFLPLVRIQEGSSPHILVSKKLLNYNLTVYVYSDIEKIVTLKQNFFWFTLLIISLGSVLIIIAAGSILYFRSIRNSKILLWKQANFDSLTGLPNRDLMHDRLKQEIIKADRTKLPLAVILIDLDQFKEINDSMGHDIGDVLLCEVSKRLTDCLRESDTVARLGGDEFIIVVPQLSNISKIEDIAQKILWSLAEPFHLRGDLSNISASLGITLYPNDANNIDELIKHADQAMYTAKKNGRNRFCYFTLALQDAAQKRMRMSKDLRIALANNQLKVYFQPIINLSSGKVYKAEALLRWFHPERGMVSPAEFIPLAEENRLILEIGAWVRAESIVWCKRWNGFCREPFQISINKSPVELMDETGIDSVSTFISLLAQHNMDGKNFVFEITEGMLLNLSENVSNKLLALRDSNIQVSLDDFGTGYSSLSYLIKLDIDYLKIDRSFISNLALNSDDLVLCEAIINMAHKLGLQVIAEGVETEQQRDLLIQANCDYAQGFLFSKPKPPEELEIWLRENNRG